MVELIETLLPEEKRQPLTAGNLKAGIENINAGFSLQQVIKLINELTPGKVAIVLVRSRKLMEISAPSSQKRRIGGYPKEWDSSIYATDLINLQTNRALGSIRLLRPVGFVAVIPESIKKDPRETQIDLYIRCPKAKVKQAIKKVIGNIPPNWQFNK